MTRDFGLADDLPPNGTLIQASAGTGKTYSVAAIVALAIAEDATLRIGNVLVTTYTRNAAAELRERIRARMQASAQLLRDRPPPPGYTADALDERLRADAAGRLAKARRLERAVAEFDTATIGTIHSISAQVLRLAGIPATDSGQEDLRERVVAEVVNDAIVAETASGAGPHRDWDEAGLRQLVEKMLGDPFIVPWFDASERSAEEREALAAAARLVEACAARVQDRMRATPSFDDLLRRARDEVTGDDPKAVSFRKALEEKFRLAIVDEAQDTSRLQWELLHAIFPPDGDRRLIAVGDPKQAIYGFRGADVTAYLQFAERGLSQPASSQPGSPQPGISPTSGAATEPPRRTLRENRRSDGPLLDALNATMAAADFGAGIRYEAVRPVPERATSRLEGLRPVELIDSGEAWLEDVAVAKVHELLTSTCVQGGPPRPFRPDECCVLCRTNRVGTAIAEKLGLLGIPAVTTGTASVMSGQMAEDLRLVLDAMARPSDAGRARRAAATAFFGRLLTEAAALGDEEQQAIQEQLALWNAMLERRGVAAMAGEIMADTEVAARLAVGREGERRIVDFAHVVELLHEASGGRGAPARVVLEHFATLAAKEETSELVSRRVESDEDAVRIMTVHAAKGLQFPAVVVVDRWFAKDAARQRGAAVFYAGRERRLDVGLALRGIGTSAVAKATLTAAENEELRRLMYVAVTRPQHHVAILRSAGWEDSLLAALLPSAPATADDIPEDLRDTLAVRSAAALPRPARWAPPKPTTQPASPGLAIGPDKVEQTFRRTSFSDIKNSAARIAPNHFAPAGRGHDEVDSAEAAGGPAGASAGEALGTAPDPAAPDDAGRADGVGAAAAAAGLEAFTLADLPGGTAFGSTVHEIFERAAVGPGQATDAIAVSVRGLVAEVATSRQLRSRQEPLVEMIVESLLTPFGGPPGAPFRDLRFVDFGPADRLAEMDFEMGMADLGRGVLASDVGRVLGRFLPADDPLHDYARLLAGETFNVPLAGLINGQIDAVLRLPGRPADDPRLLIADYKTNRLHRAEDSRPLAAYAPKRLVEAMAHAHYPLQALVYGTAIWRMLRWRLSPRRPADWDAGTCIAGVVYGFVRGMKGAATPVDAAGRRYGVFTWQPPPAVWRRLSNLLAGDLTGVRP